LPWLIRAIATLSRVKTKGKYAISTLIFQKNFLRLRPQIPILGRGYGTTPQTSLPLALRRFAPLRLARDLRSLHRHVPPPYKNPGYMPAHHIHISTHLHDTCECGGDLLSSQLFPFSLSPFAFPSLPFCSCPFLCLSLSFLPLLFPVLFAF